MLPRTRALSLWALILVGPSLAAGEVLRSPFVRGDTNASGQIDVSDGIAVLQHLFGGNSPPTCLDAADVNADAVLDVTDGVSLFTFLFLGRGMPPPPYPDCGYPEELGGGLGCEAFAPCETFTILAGSAPPPPQEPIHLACLGGDVAPPVVLEPELFDALTHLAPGEPILALRDLPGFREYMEQTRVFTGIPPYPWSADDYTATVTITLETSEDEACLEPGPELLETLRARMVLQNVLDPAVPLESMDPPRVCGEGKHSVRLKARKPDGEPELHSGLIEVLRSADKRRAIHLVIQSPKPPAGPRLTSDLRCEWAVALTPEPKDSSFKPDGWTWNIFGYDREHKDPNDQTKDGFGRGREGWYTSQRGGPWLDLWVERRLSNCHSPATNVSQQAKGGLNVALGVLCSENFEDVAPPPCDSVVDAKARYDSALEVTSDTGILCHIFGPNDVDSFACSDFTFAVDDKPSYYRAAVAANGNNVTSKTTYALAAKLDELGKPGVGVDVGYQEIVEHDTGVKTAIVTGSPLVEAEPVPVELELSSSGIARVNGYNSSIATASVETSVCGIWFVGHSRCPQAGSTAGAYLIGTAEKLREIDKLVESFLRTRGYRGQLDWYLPRKEDELPKPPKEQP